MQKSERQRIAGDLLRLARGLVATDFPSQHALDEYLKEHPKADRSNHRVVENRQFSQSHPGEKVKLKSGPSKEEGQHSTVTVERTKGVTKTFFSEDDMKLPEEVLQKTNKSDETYEKAIQAREMMLEWLDKGKGLDKQMGARHHDSEIYGNISNTELVKPGPVIVSGNLKAKDRATEKVESDYEGNWNRLTDLVRATIAVDNLSEIGPALAEAKKSGMKLVKKPKDRFLKPTDVDYRDLMMNVEFPNGHVGELQINVKSVMVAKKFAHPYYEQYQKIERDIKNQGRKDNVTAEERRELDALNAEMKKIYSTYWEEEMSKDKLVKTSSMGQRKASTKTPAAGTRYYEYEDFPAMWEEGKLPVFFFEGRKTYATDLHRFFTYVRTISKKEFDSMLKKQRGEGHDKTAVARSLLVIAKEMLR